MAQSGVQVDGLRETIRDLKAIGVEVDDLKDAFAKIAREAADEVAASAPRKSGRLADSVRGNRAQSKAVVMAGRATVPYAGAINYGWRARGIEPTGFIQEGEQRYTPTAVRRLEEEIDAVIRQKGLDR